MPVNQQRIPKWSKTREGKPHQLLKRQGFLLGSDAPRVYAKPLSRNPRTGFGNFEITRQASEKVQPLPRHLVETRKPEEIELGLKTVEKLTKVSIPDKNDTQWLAERKKVIAHYQRQGKSKDWIDEVLKASPPLGREQRKVKVNVADEMIQSMSNTKTMLRAIASEVKTNVNLNATNKITILQTLTQLVNTTEALSNIFVSPEATGDLDTILSGLGTVHWTKFGLKSQYISKDVYIANRGKVNLCVMLNSRALGLTFSKSVVGIGGYPIYINSIHSAFQKGGDDIVLDLMDNTMKNLGMDERDVKVEAEMLRVKLDEESDTKILEPKTHSPM